MPLYPGWPPWLIASTWMAGWDPNWARAEDQVDSARDYLAAGEIPQAIVMICQSLDSFRRGVECLKDYVNAIAHWQYLYGGGVSVPMTDAEIFDAVVRETKRRW